ncbi:MAG TPA: hypothetical protein P5338_06305 [Bacteroidales bacterium]|nr:hypothetical protein [Bacteroidales bacterium]
MKTCTFSSTGIRNLTTGLVLFCVAILPMAVSAQLTGPKTVGTGGDYATVELAIADLNLMGVGPGGVTFNVAAGHTETLSSATAGTITATGTAANPIVFQKSGAGANPVITAFAWTAATAYDGMIIIAGGDYITFDAIDLQENAANTTNRTDWGYALVKKQNTAPFDGCQYVTIKNCNITLNKANTTAIGIYSGNHIATATTSLTLTAVSDAMSNCSFLNNTISNVYIAISLNGYNSTSYYNLNNSVTGNQISNYGGAGSTSYGIYTIYNGELLVSNNTIVSGTGTTTTLYGIFCSTAASKNITITGNNVTVTGGATSSALYGISNSVGSTAAGNTVIISDNTVSNCTYPTATSGLFHAIVNSATAATVNIFNNNVNNNVLSGTGAFIGIYNSASMGTNPLNIYGNNISNNSKTGTSGILYGCQATTATVNFYQNIISFNSITGGSSSLYGYYNVGSPASETYHSNQIFNLSHNGTGTTTGIQISTASGTKNVYNNQIYNLTSGGAVNGYSSSYGSPLNFYNNTIFNLTTTGASTVATGITFSGPSSNIYNNFISGINPTSSSSANGAIGINITGGTSQNIYYNTVFLNATSSSTTTFGSSGIYVSSSPTTTLANNIIVNTSIPGPTGGNTVAFRYSSTTYTNLSANTNNNCYFANAPGPFNLIFFDGTNSDQTIGNYKTRMIPRESYSVSELPPFLNVGAAPYDLHLSPSLPTQCESGGKVIAGITTDFDGDPRNSSTPDIGADEGSFTVLDLLGPIITYTMLPPSGYQISNLIATITDISGIPASGTGLPMAYWSIGLLGAQNAVQGVSLGNNQYSFSIGAGSVPGDTIYYFLVAQDNAPTFNISVMPGNGAGGFTPNPPFAATPPTNMYYFVRMPAMSGIYTIDNTLPTGGTNFNNFTDAATMLNGAGLTGPVVFNVIAGQSWNMVCAASPNNYGIKITNKTTTGTNTVTFQKFGAGANPTLNITGTSSNNDAGIWLFESDYITFDGINILDAGSSSADYLEFGLHLNGSATDGCSFNVFKNGLVDLNRLNTTSRGIRLLSSSASAASGSNNYNKFYNNTILDAAQGYYLLGTSTYKNIGNEIGTELSGESTIKGLGFLATTASVIGVYANYQDELEIFNTTIDSLNGSYSTYPTTVGIYAINSNNTQITGNTIRRITTGAGDPVGINLESAIGSANTINNNTLKEISANVSGNINSMRLYGGTGVGLNVYNNEIFGLTNAGSGTSNGIYCSYSNSNVNIYKNKVHDFYNSGTSGNIIYGIFMSGTGNTYNVSNNMVYDFRAPNTSGTAPAVSGIRAENSACNVFYNSVLLNYVSASTGNTSAALYATSSAVLNSRNNLFVNNTDITTGTRAAAFWYNSTSYAGIAPTTNNNIYYCGTPGAKNLIFYNGTTGYATYTDYKAVMVGKDQSSYTENPPFVSTAAPYNLHMLTNVMTLAEGY